MSKIYHFEIFGLRKEKYDWLDAHDINNVEWNEIEPKGEFYLFIPQNAKLQDDYLKFKKITEIFPVNSVGIVTARDSFVIDFDKKQLEKRIRQFIDTNIDDEIIKQTYDLRENKSWKIKDRRKNLKSDEDWQIAFTKILYRPFDVRWIFYHDELIERSRKDVMRHMLEENVGLMMPRRVETKIPWQHCFCGEGIVEHVAVSSKTIDYVFPLYLYPNTDKNDLFSEHETGEKKPNIKQELFDELKKNFNKDATPEEIFYYIYAVLYGNTYREKYAEFLKIDFPRVPFAKDYNLFIKLAELGKQLADLHLLKSKDLENMISKFQGEGENKVEKPKYEDEKVWINKSQYFDGIKEEVWEYQIGGYQVCEKWLKDRKGRMLTLDEIKTYCKIVTALSKTIEIQREIDKYFEEVEKTV